MPSRAAQQYTTTTPVLTISAVLISDEQTSTYLATSTATAACSISKHRPLPFEEQCTLYIADTINHRIVRWHLDDSEEETIAGSQLIG
jgi:hypothetical protein